MMTFTNPIYFSNAHSVTGGPGNIAGHCGTAREVEQHATLAAIGDAFGHNVEVSRYRFGIDQLAADRLRLVAQAYDPISRPFLTAHAPSQSNVAVDLGCGPAFTTELLNEVCRPETIVGVDTSENFIVAARRRLPGARFEIHDVTELPLPGAPADVIYARLLLAHLAEPKAVAQAWRGQLAPGGRLLIEDLEDVVNPPGPLRDYEDMSATIVRFGGGVMYAGTELSDFGGVVTPVTVPAWLAAKIYLFNVRFWLEKPNLPVAIEQLQGLEQGLIEISMNGCGSSVSWIVRQLVLAS
jgi:trans-aconitate 2-methyltransferase